MSRSPATLDHPDHGVHNEFPADAKKAAKWVVSSVAKVEYVHLKAAETAVREYMDVFAGKAEKVFHDELFHLLGELGRQSREMYTFYPLTVDSRLTHQPTLGQYGGFRIMKNRSGRGRGGGPTFQYWIIPVSKFSLGQRPIRISYQAKIIKQARNSVTVQVVEESKTSGSIGIGGSMGPVTVKVGHTESRSRKRTESQSSGQTKSDSKSATLSINLIDVKRTAIAFVWNGQLQLPTVSKITDWGYRVENMTSSVPVGPFLGESLEGKFSERSLKDAALPHVAPYLVYQQQEFAKDLAHLYFAQQR